MSKIMRTGHNAIRIFSALAAITVSMLAVSCRKTSISEESAICLDASFFYTRALITSETAMETESATDGTAIGVFGDKIAKGIGTGGLEPDGYEGRQTVVFDNQPVTYSSGWTYAPTKYWDRGAYYHFAAYWPEGNAEADVENHTMTVYNIPAWQKVDGNEKDYMYAKSMGAAVSYLPEGKVNFTFKHFLAKINIQAYYIGDQERQVTITGIQLGKDKENATAVKDVPLSSGDASFTYSYASGDSAPVIHNETGDWHELITDVNGSTVPKTAYCSDDATDPKVFPGYPNTSDNGGIADICSWLVVPFSSASNLPITVCYRIGDVVKKPSPTVTTTLADFESGKEYTIILKFDTNADGMECQAVYVKNWVPTAPDVNKTVHNW